MLLKATLEQARAVPIPPGRRSAQVLGHGSMELRFYAPRGKDEQTPHDRDELYLVARGSGSFFCAGERTACGMGDVLFVSAGDEHRFEDFTDDFEVWVVFYGPAGGEQAAR